MMPRCVLVLVMLALFMDSVDSQWQFAIPPCIAYGYKCSNNCCSGLFCVHHYTERRCFRKGEIYSMSGTKRNVAPLALLPGLVGVVMILH